MCLYLITYRYLSLQRSFRGQRPSRFANNNLTPISSSPSTPTDLSLSLTRAEAESLSQANSRTSRSQTGTSRSKRKSSRWRFWQRGFKTVPQSPRSESSRDDDIMPVSPGWEGSPPPSVNESGEVMEREGGGRWAGASQHERRRDRRSVSRETSSGSRSSITGSVAGMSEEGEGETVLDVVQQSTSTSTEIRY